MNPRTALIAGATGLVGSHVLSLLLESRHYSSVTAVTRKPTGHSHPKLVEIIGDSDHLPDLPVVQDVFCALGTTIAVAGSKAAFRKIDHDYPLAIARQTASAGASQYLLVSSVGADKKSPNFYLHTKGELEEELAALPFRGLHVFRPSFLIGDRTEKRSGERVGIVMARVLKPFLLGSLRKYRAIPAAAVARAMVEAGVRAEYGRHEYSYGAIAPFIRR